MSSQSPKFLGANLGSDLVIIRVGPKRKEFIVHKNIICNSIEYFKIIVKLSPKKEGQEAAPVIYLPNDTPGAFALLIDYIYRGSIPLGDSTQHLHDLYALYFFAERVGPVVLKDKVMDAVQDLAAKCDLLSVLIEPHLIFSLFDRTKVTDKLYGLSAFTIDAMTYDIFQKSKARRKAEDETITMTKDEITGVLDLGNLHPSIPMYFFDSYQSLLQQGEPGDPRIRDDGNPIDRCWYHCHGEADSCRENKSLSDDPPIKTEEVSNNMEYL